MHIVHVYSTGLLCSLTCIVFLLFFFYSKISPCRSSVQSSTSSSSSSSSDARSSSVSSTTDSEGETEVVRQKKVPENESLILKFMNLSQHRSGKSLCRGQPIVLSRMICLLVLFTLQS